MTAKKIWTAEAIKQYPKQWIVFVDMECDPETSKFMGIVHFVTPSETEAHDKAMTLGDSLGLSMVLEGFNDTPQIGGLQLWNH